MIKFSQDEKALIFMSQFEFMTSVKFDQVLRHFKNPREIFTAEYNKLLELNSVLKNNFTTFVEGLSNFKEDEFFGNLNKRGIKVTTVISDDYPNKLFRLDNKPYVLYYVGNIKLAQEKAIAIVGTRNPSNYGKTVTEKYAKTLAENGLCIVSGLASGVDKIAHESALLVNGNTIAVLGGGFDHIFPSININLAREIGKKGLILTEYYLTQRPTKYSFPARNRIIAGLSSAVLITEAKIGSGSIYTKNYGDEIGIDTFVVPGNITSEKSSATNKIIKEGSGQITISPDDILSFFDIKKKEKTEQESTMQLSQEQAEIVKLLKDGEKDFEFLQEKTNYSTQNLNFSLTTLEISGIIKKLAGNLYELID